MEEGEEDDEEEDEEEDDEEEDDEDEDEEDESDDDEAPAPAKAKKARKAEPAGGVTEDDFFSLAAMEAFVKEDEDLIAAGPGDDAAGDGDATPPLIDATLRLAGIDDDDGDGSAPPPPPGLPLCRDVVNQLPKTPCMTKVANACKRIPRGSPSAPEASEADGSPTKKRLCRADEDFIESHQEIRDAAKRACKECDANKSFFEDTLFAP